MLQKLKKSFLFFIGLLSQNRCYACGQVGHFFCQICSQKIEEYTPYCYFCKEESQDFITHTHCRQHFPIRQVIVLTHYRNTPMPRLLKHAKYYGKYPIYHDILVPHADFFRRYMKKEGVLIPVPMHFLRKWKRGYNQAEAIAEVLSNICHLPTNNTLLRRKKHTKQQSRLSQSERLKNLEEAFVLRKNSLPKDTPLYLVDDIVSTGATLTEIARLLQKNGFSDVRAICIASD